MRNRRVAPAVSAANLVARVEADPLDQVELGGSLDEVLAKVEASGLAWVAILEALNTLAENEAVKKTPAAAEFVQLMTALTQNRSLSRDLEEVLRPIDGVMPLGALGERSRKAHSAAASAGRKLTEASAARIVEMYADLVRKGERYGARKSLARRFDVSESTIDSVLKKRGAKPIHK